MPTQSLLSDLPDDDLFGLPVPEGSLEVLPKFIENQPLAQMTHAQAAIKTDSTPAAFDPNNLLLDTVLEALQSTHASGARQAHLPRVIFVRE